MGADSLCGIGNIFVSDNLIEGMKVRSWQKKKKRNNYMNFILKMQYFNCRTIFEINRRNLYSNHHHIIYKEE